MIEIARPYCDWIAVKFKDGRRGSMWLCNECGHRAKGKNIPQCPCEKIEINGLGQ